MDKQKLINEARKRWRERRKAEGGCIDCATGTAGTTLRCPECQAKVTSWMFASSPKLKTPKPQQANHRVERMMELAFRRYT